MDEDEVEEAILAIAQESKEITEHLEDEEYSEALSRVIDLETRLQEIRTHIESKIKGDVFDG